MTATALAPECGCSSEDETSGLLVRPVRSMLEAIAAEVPAVAALPLRALLRPRFTDRVLDRLGERAVVLSAVAPAEARKASGANAAIREIGGVLGVAILAAVFSHAGGDITGGQAFTDGVRPAVSVGAVVVAVGTIMAMLIPRREQHAPDPVPVLAAA